MRRPARAVLAAALLCACAPDADDPPVRPPGPRTVILVSLDTLRPERLGLYGGAPEVSPVLDALAEEAVVFDQALAPSPWTLPSHMTMLTGLDPHAHGVINSSHGLADDVTTLAESLTAAGYATAAFTDGGFVSADHGFDQGFGTYDDLRDDAPGGVNGFRRIMPRALAWLAERPTEDLFLFLHTFDPHTPYHDVEPGILERFRARPVADDPRDHRLDWARHLQAQVNVGVTSYRRMGELLNDYDAGIAQADEWLGRLFDQLRAAGRWEQALVIVTSDHGESFFDHGLHVGHGLTLRDDEVAIPLLLRLPGGEGGGQRIPDLVSLVDVTRTVLDVEAFAAPTETQGEALRPLVRGRPRSVDWVLGFSQNIRAYSLVQGGFKFISPVAVQPLLIAERHLGPMSPPSLAGPVEGAKRFTYQETELVYDMVGDPLGLLDLLPASFELYDRAADPDERHDLHRLPEYDDVYKRMARDCDRLVKASVALGFLPEDVALDPSQQRLLSALGYVGNDTPDGMQDLPRAMREWINNPHAPPDTAALGSADAAVHRLRIKHLSGEALSGSEARELWAAGDAYLAWADVNRGHLSRVDWRLHALGELARAAGIELPMAQWTTRLANLTR